ncbi:hypothetical protein CEXT_560641 [Caerostris extrusa]|uniref:Uncharacterized protein n=1 Tax=Caerostris extrusa TaxID=172846 RepID=A0AAV4MH30_CAEEX|nr:hypothetical protein CEXT_560641 [Caerostris extrusa]
MFHHHHIYKKKAGEESLSQSRLWRENGKTGKNKGTEPKRISPFSINGAIYLGFRRLDDGQIPPSNNIEIKTHRGLLPLAFRLARGKIGQYRYVSRNEKFNCLARRNMSSSLKTFKKKNCVGGENNPPLSPAPALSIMQRPSD